MNSIIPPHLKAANLGGHNDPQIYGNTKLCLSWSSCVPSGSSRSTDLFQSVIDDGSCRCSVAAICLTTSVKGSLESTLTFWELKTSPAGPELQRLQTREEVLERSGWAEGPGTRRRVKTGWPRPRVDKGTRLLVCREIKLQNKNQQRKNGGSKLQERNSGAKGWGQYDEKGHVQEPAARKIARQGPCLQDSSEPRPAAVPNPSSHQDEGCGRQRRAEHRAEHHQLQRERNHSPYPGRPAAALSSTYTHAEAGRAPTAPAQQPAETPRPAPRAPAAHSALARPGEEHAVLGCPALSPCGGRCTVAK